MDLKRGLLQAAVAGIIAGDADASSRGYKIQSSDDKFLREVVFRDDAEALQSLKELSRRGKNKELRTNSGKREKVEASTPDDVLLADGDDADATPEKNVVDRIPKKCDDFMRRQAAHLKHMKTALIPQCSPEGIEALFCQLNLKLVEHGEMLKLNGSKYYDLFLSSDLPKIRFEPEATWRVQRN